MSVYFEGNAFIDSGQIQNVLLTSSTIQNSYISGTSATISNLYASIARIPLLTVGSLSVTGSSFFVQGITTSNLYVSGDSEFHSPITIYDNLTVTSGSIVFNNVDVSPSAGDISKEQSFMANNNQQIPANISNFLFNNSIVRCFDAVVSVSIITTGNVDDRFAYFNLIGINKQSSWILRSSFVGDVTGLKFSITSSGQIQYTSTDIGPNFISNTIKFRATTTSL